MLLSDQHRTRYRHYYQQKILPPARPHAWQPQVDGLILSSGAPPWTVLDYGCGPQANLSRFAPYPVQNYDPGVPAYAAMPTPADLVVCWHVLEHVEPHCLHAVLAHLRHLAQQAILCAVSCAPSTKILPDGAAWHSLVQPPEWWETTLYAAWGRMKAGQGLLPAARQTEYQALFVLRREAQGQTVDRQHAEGGGKDD